MMRFSTAGGVGIAAVLAASVYSQAAGAQAWIGQVVGDMAAAGARARCMSGEPLPPEEVAEAREPALVVMRQYWERVSAAGSADVSAAFHPRGRVAWVSDGESLRRSQLRAVADPLARQPGAAFAYDPAAFVRAADGGTARGLWVVGGADAPLGYYVAEFSRQAGTWKLRRIEVLGAAESPPEVTQYCNQPGDVDEARAAAAEREARRAERRAARAAERARRQRD